MAEPNKDFVLLSALMQALVDSYGLRHVLTGLRDLCEEDTNGDRVEDGAKGEAEGEAEGGKPEQLKRKRGVHVVEDAVSSEDEDEAEGGEEAKKEEAKKEEAKKEEAKKAKKTPSKKTRGKGRNG